MSGCIRFCEVALAVFLSTLPMVGQQTVTRTAQQEKSLFRKIYDEDQKNTDESARSKFREEMRQLIREGKVQTGQDYYYAAFVYQHGHKPSDYLYAHVLAVTAVSKGFNLAIWLCAATLDRYLRSVHQPQVFGTQTGSLDASPPTQEPYDKKMISDELREMWCVTPYSTQAQIMSDYKTGKALRSTRICPTP